jgi:hypothetical protein
MWLDARFQYIVTRFDPSQHVVPWRIDIKAVIDESAGTTGPNSYVVGRILADEVRRFEIAEWGDDPADAADADSAGLESAYAALIDDSGQFRDAEFNGVSDPIVYMYRFRLHDDFASCKLAVLDAFCRLFPNEALILAQYSTTWLSISEFNHLGFKKLVPAGTRIVSNDKPVHVDQLQFMIRDNTLATTQKVGDYPKQPPWAMPEHEEWVNSHGPWKGLC